MARRQVELSCPYCDVILRVNQDVMGHEVKCPSCRDVFTAAESRMAPSPRRLLCFLLGAVLGPLGVVDAFFLSHGRGFIAALAGMALVFAPVAAALMYLL